MMVLKAREFTYTRTSDGIRIPDTETLTMDGLSINDVESLTIEMWMKGTFTTASDPVFEL